MVVEVRVGKPDVSLRPALELVSMTGEKVFLFDFSGLDLRACGNTFALSLLREVRQAKRRPRAKALPEYEREHLQRNDAVVAAYRSGRYTLREIGDYFSLHYSRISNIIHVADLATGEENRKT
jgi:hypothetical protein